MIVDAAEEGAFERDTTVGEVVDSWVEMEVAEHGLGILEDLCSYTESLVKALILAGSIGVDECSPDWMGRQDFES